MTKRSSLFLIILTLVFGVAITLDVHAASCGGVDTTILNCSEDGEGAVTHIVLLILDIMTIGIGILGVIGISVAGVQYLTAAGDTTKATKSKRRIFEIVIGLACYALIWVGAEWLMPGGAFNAAKSNANSTQTTQNNGSNATNTNTANPPNTPTANQSNATPTNNSASSQSNSKSSSNTSSNSNSKTNSSNKSASSNQNSNGSKNKCAKGYRSNYKYKLYNNVMEIFVKKQKNVSYVETFDSIMNSKFQFTNAWQDYKTTDGVHWDKPTAYKYFDFWMSQVGGI